MEKGLLLGEILKHWERAMSLIFILLKEAVGLQYRRVNKCT